MSFDFSKIKKSDLVEEMESNLIDKILWPDVLNETRIAFNNKNILYPEKFPDGLHLHIKLGQAISFERQLLHIINCIAVCPGFENMFTKIDVPVQRRIDINRLYVTAILYNYKEYYREIYDKYDYKCSRRKSPVDILLSFIGFLGKSHVYLKGVIADIEKTGIILSWNTFYSGPFKSMQEIIRFLNVIDSNPQIYKDIYYDSEFLQCFMEHLNYLYAFNKVKIDYRISKEDLNKIIQDIKTVNSDNNLYGLVHYIRTNLTKPYKSPIKVVKK